MIRDSGQWFTDVIAKPMNSNTLERCSSDMEIAWKRIALVHEKSPGHT
jgi:hypothetical protein